MHPRGDYISPMSNSSRKSADSVPATQGSQKVLPPKPAKPAVTRDKLDAFADEAMKRYDSMFKALAK